MSSPPVLLPSGNLDTSFGGDGLTSTPVGAGADQARSIAIQADCKYVVAGWTDVGGGDEDFAVLRFNIDGSLDTTFSGDGIQTTGFAGDDRAYSVAIQADGRIVVAGTANYNTGTSDFALARYNTDGSLDTSFDGDGRLTTDMLGQDAAAAVAIQPDGGILVAGGAGLSQFGIARYTSSGALDTSFSADGKLTGQFGSSTSRASALALQSDGTIVVAGYGFNGHDWDLGIARFTPMGVLDNSFGGGGKLLIGLDPNNTGSLEEARAIAIQADGKILIAGTTTGSGAGDVFDAVLIRLTSLGVLDTDFGGGDGIVTLDLSNQDVFASVLVQADGKIMVGGSVQTGFGEALLVRYNADGTLDTTFSGDGVFSTTFGGGTSATYDLAVAANGQAVGVGDSFAGTQDIGLLRLASGVTDQSLVANHALSYTVPAGIFFDPDGDPLAYSATLDNGSPLPAWLSFNPATRTFAGTPADGDFGTSQVKVTASDGTGSVAAGFQIEVTTDFIEALRAGGDPRWNADSPHGTPGTALTFSFMTNAPIYANDDAQHREVSTFVEFSAAQMEAVRTILSMYASVAGFTFTEVPDAGDGGLLRFGNNSQTGSSGYAYLPFNGTSGLESNGDVWINKDTAGNLAPAMGNSAFETLLHEIGHALGLKHPGLYGGGAPPFLDAAVDNDQYTVMSYNERDGGLFLDVTGSSPLDYAFNYVSISDSTPMLYDVAAIQFLYGANTAAHSGNDAYTFDPAAPFFTTIWDAGGNDTISAANFSIATLIDLRDGHFSSLHILSEPLPPGYSGTLGDYDGTDNLAIAYDAIIENATGGSGNDTLTGNAVSNVLDGGAGADSISGGAGNDSVLGGLGNDVLRGNQGADTLLGNDGNDQLLGDNGNDTIAGALGADNINGNNGFDTVDGGEGNDTLHGGTEFDILFGSDGDDLVAGDKGNDTLFGDAGNDLVQGGLGDDVLRGNQGADTLVGDDGADQLFGDNGNDTIAGGVGDDNINGNNGFDTVDGGEGNDTIHGGTEFDLLLGGDGNDQVFGDKGNDTLVGGAGDDTLVGGIGVDFFRYDAASLGTGDVTANGHDVISDGTGELLSLLGLNDDLAIGGTALNALSSDVVVGGALSVGTSVAFTGGVLEIDVNGNGSFNAANDFQLTLAGVTSVTYNATDDLFHLA